MLSELTPRLQTVRPPCPFVRSRSLRLRIRAALSSATVMVLMFCLFKKLRADQRPARLHQFLSASVGGAHMSATRSGGRLMLG